MLRTTDRQAAEQLHPKAFVERLRPETSSVPHSYIADDKTRFLLTEDGTLVAEVPWGDCEPLRYVFRHWTTQCPPSWVGDRDGSVKHLWDELRPPKPQKPKRVRCTCLKCGKINYLVAAGIDTTEPYLCQVCDDRFIAWQMADEDNKYRTLEAFLAKRR